MIRKCIIPKNKQGIDDWEYGIYDKENMVSIEIPESEFMPAYLGRFFDAINKEYDLLIDAYEEEEIPLKKLAAVLEFLQKNRDSYSLPSFEKALKTGISFGTYVECVF